MDNNNNQPLVQPVQQPQIPPVSLFISSLYNSRFTSRCSLILISLLICISRLTSHRPSMFRAIMLRSESSRQIFILLQNSLREERKLISFVSYPWSASLHLKSLPVYFPESLKALMTCHPTVHLNRSLMFHQRSFSQPMSLHGY